jgi:hypothetical protein
VTEFHPTEPFKCCRANGRKGAEAGLPLAEIPTILSRSANTKRALISSSFRFFAHRLLKRRVLEQNKNIQPRYSAPDA